MSAPLDEFAQQLIEHVRDRAIRSCDALAQGAGGGELGRRWRSTLGAASAAGAMEELLPDVVDQVLFNLLDAIDNNRLPLSWFGGDRCFALQELGQGEMGGFLMMGSGGWVDRYSAQRSFDPLTDLDED